MKSLAVALVTNGNCTYYDCLVNIRNIGITLGNCLVVQSVLFPLETMIQISSSCGDFLRPIFYNSMKTSCEKSGHFLQSYMFNPILPGLLNTLQTRGAYFTPLLIRLFFILEAYNLVCGVLLVISFDFNFKFVKF